MRCAAEGVYGGCLGPVQAHHVVHQRALKDQYRRYERLLPNERLKLRPTELPMPLKGALEDRRNLVALCHRHHGWLHGARFRLVPPESAKQFAEELGLLPWLERHYPEDVVGESKVSTPTP